jgi:hypothetical protein
MYFINIFAAISLYPPSTLQAMPKRIYLLLISFLMLTQTNAQSKVYLLPTLHGLHKTNTNYTYDSLKQTIARINPDVVAVEMRSEDIGADTNYLKKNYPYEMWMMRYWFNNKNIAGFDWIGADIEGKPIPERYWQDVSRPKYLQRKLNIDSVYTAKLTGCQFYTEERLNILKTLSLKGILTSNDAILTKEYYNCLDLQLQNSDYEELTQFYTTRNNKMKENISFLLQQHPNKTIVIVTGADHYPYLLEHLHKLKAKVLQL